MSSASIPDECKEICRCDLPEAPAACKDPVVEQRKKDKPPKKGVEKIRIRPSQISAKIRPSVGTRLDLVHFEEKVCGGGPPPDPKPKYVIPRTKKQQRLFEKNRANTAKKIFCKYKTFGIPSPIPTKKVDIKLAVPSAQIGEAKVKLHPVSPDPSWVYPYPQTEKELELKKPKSGIFINETTGKEETQDYDSFDLVYSRKGRPTKKVIAKKHKKKRRKISRLQEGEEYGEGGRRRKKKKRKKSKRASGGPEEDATENMLEVIAEEMEEMGGGEEDLDYEDYLTKQFRRKVSMISKSTSYQSKDIESEVSVTVEQPLLSRYLQKFRRDSEIKRYEPPRKKIKRGTLESHSFTNVKCQPMLKEFYFGSKEGTMHQGDEHFPENSRDKQGLCMPVAAYCYSILKHPNLWISENIDEILDIGNALFLQSASEMHLHSPGIELKPSDLQKFCYLNEKKVRFLVDEPEVTGLINSNDKRVFNLTKGLTIFFARQTAGILQSFNVNIAIWKDKHYYFFDAKPRTKDLFVSPMGTAVMANFYDIPSIVTVLLQRSHYGNWPFVIYTLKALRVLNKDCIEEVQSTLEIDSKSNYNIINANKAVVLASFELGDKCFDFTRNKQALTMATVCLVYSRITPPSAWHKTTVDKIMIVGNQLYLECMQCESIVDLSLDNLPALFTIGPYIVEIYIYANRFADVMYKKCNCQFKVCMTDFFDHNTNAIVQIGGKFTLAVWKQRNMFYCFDPYSRNSEGLHCRDGTACVSMHSNVDSLIDIIIYNFDTKDYIFYIHALKVCKIHRDPVQSELFPKHLTMNDYPLENLKCYKMAKSKKPATAKPITVDYTAFAMRKLLAGETPDPSVFELGSTVESLGVGQLPAMVGKHPSRSMLRAKMPKIDDEVIADLDSPSLSDTQIEPPLPQQPKIKEEISFMDLDSFQLTLEEIELQDTGEGENALFGLGEDEDFLLQQEEEGLEDDWYYAANELAQVDSRSLDSLDRSKISEQINTDITFFPIKREVLYPTFIRDRQEMRKRLEPVKFKDDGWDAFLADEPQVTKSEELARETNFVDLPDDSQIISGSQNLVAFGEDIEFMAPFVCIMAGVVSKKYSIYSWSGDIVDYILKCGVELYKSSKLRYDQVAKLEIPKVSLGKTVYKVLVEYVFDTYSRQNILELSIEKILFVRSDIGVLVTPTYACALIYKNHLYYLYDGFGNNEVGLSEGMSNEGVACVSRFKSVHDLATRIMYNKKKREIDESVIYTRFVLSSVRVKMIQEPREGKKRDKKKQVEKEMGKYGGGEDEIASEKADKTDEESAGDEEEEGEEEEEKEAQKKKEPQNKVGYQYKDGNFVIEGTRMLSGRDQICEELKEDHFACLCACLVLLSVPIKKWDTKKVDAVLDYGKHVFSHADDLEISEKRSIKNVLIEKNFFDIIVKKIKIENWKNNRNLNTGIDTLLTKRLSYFLVQFGNACYIVHKTECYFHLFDPYGVKVKRKKEKKQYKAGWLRCKDLKTLKRRLRRLVVPGGESYIFYNFEVTSIRKAPKDLLISHRLQEYDRKKDKKPELIGKTFYEDNKWLCGEAIPWNRKGVISASGQQRAIVANMWHNWDVEYPKDLFSMAGNVNQSSEKFSEKSRGKQTLSNLVVAIGMLEIYDFTEWNSAVIDSILVNGENYFLECVSEIDDPDYELSMDDLKPDFSIFPYTLKMKCTPVVEGTMFLVRVQQFNLYKALRYFFENINRRSGIISVAKTNTKKHLAFGKTKQSEYFVFDTDSFGGLMFNTNQGLPYIMRMTTLNRLLHVLTMTLRGGDFYIFEIVTSNLQPMA